jgi:molybdopterin molybdotransferase
MDVREGRQVLSAGARLGARQIALCAALGIGRVPVHRSPAVAILATGDELVEPGAPLRVGQIYNSNGHALAAAVREAGAEVRVLGIARDDPKHLQEKLREAAAGSPQADLLLTSGGVSVGDFDYVKDVMGGAGTIDFWRVRIRPGKPLMFGTIDVSSGGRRLPILGLPGNPTSTMVTFYVFALPVIRTLMGARDPAPQPLNAVTDDALDNRGGRETFFRVVAYVRDGRLRCRLAGGQDSSMVLPLADATALARVAADITRVDPGSGVDLYLLDGCGLGS